MKKRRASHSQQVVLIIVLVALATLVVWSRAGRKKPQITRSAGEASYSPAESKTLPHIIHPAMITEDNNENRITGNDTLPDMQFSREFLLGKSDPLQGGPFVPVDNIFGVRSGMYMHRKAYDAFRMMHAAALEAGVSLTIVSAMRTFDHQKRIWDNKWNGRQILFGDILATTIDDPVERALEILRFSAMPGTSRHHWGTDIDLNSLNNSYFERGEGRRVYEWLLANAASYGFCQPYTARGNGRSVGHEEERWHWSYKPVASECLKQFAAKITYDDIRGFDGWQVAREIGIIGNFMMTVNEACI